MAKQFITFISAPLTLIYPKFETPDIFVDPITKKAGAPCYKTDGSAVNPADMEKMKAYVLSVMVKLFPNMDPETRKVTAPNGDTKTLYWPFKVDKDGNTTLTAKTGRKSKRTGELLRVPMWDAANQKMPDDVFPGGGTIGKLDLTINEMPNKAGVNFYINALQVLKLEESSFGKSGFEPTEGYAYGGGEEEDVAQSNSNFGGAAATGASNEADALKF